jgi:hypothetical protein
MRVFLSGGTTGRSRPTFYTHRDRLVQGVMNASSTAAAVDSLSNCFPPDCKAA